ncbi:ferric reductase like protein [Yoonia maricola]|uniref:Ferric reductase like protein n=1 Tax=Yoonia maricola TaxID=420999 RepID=A0A2M8W554_9RHOB|nr:ferric reductase-like transmembrane domain-containing protein [Yoonia maricola]PJI86036.1 ferric reductase like protein [Yoonia maricola]
MNLRSRLRTVLIWGALVSAVLVPILAAAASPLLQWREPIYIVAGFAGILGMCLMLVQPLLAIGVMPGVPLQTSRKVHRYGGAALVFAVVLHVAGLWVTSPPDVIDVLLFRSPTPFAIWGALAMWAVFGAAMLALLRPRLPLRLWRWGHTALVTLAVVGTIVHAVQIIGAMEPVTKALLSLAVAAALLTAIARRKVWAMGLRARRS